jgi:hypothetical protein
MSEGRAASTQRLIQQLRGLGTCNSSLHVRLVRFLRPQSPALRHRPLPCQLPHCLLQSFLPFSEATFPILSFVARPRYSTCCSQKRNGCSCDGKALQKSAPSGEISHMEVKDTMFRVLLLRKLFHMTAWNFDAELQICILLCCMIHRGPTMVERWAESTKCMELDGRVSRISRAQQLFASFYSPCCYLLPRAA